MRIRWTGRLRFLHYLKKQNCRDILCGEHRRGTESRVQAKEESHRKNRVAIQRRDADRMKVGKCVSHESRKAAIVFKIPVP